jgi:hypothetical protein
MTRAGAAAAMLTLIAPVSPGAVITTAVTQRTGGNCVLLPRIGTSSLSLLVSAGA